MQINKSKLYSIETIWIEMKFNELNIFCTYNKKKYAVATITATNWQTNISTTRVFHDNVNAYITNNWNVKMTK